MFKELRELFIFTGKEKRGIFVLLSLIALLIVINLMLPLFITHQRVDTSQWEAEVENYYAREKVDTNSEIDSSFLDITSFDPNKVSSEYLLEIGLPGKVVSNWMKYIEKGGYFKSKEMVSKIYGMTPEDYNRISDYLVFPVKETSKKIPEQIIVDVKDKGREYNNSVVEKSGNNIPLVKEPVEINSADSIGLVSVPGIGPTLASRIIKYRKMLGGYYAVVQLKEVYGLKEEHFNLALPYLSVNSDLTSRFNINFSSVNEMGRHPYIGYKIAKRIVKRRDTNGKYESPEQLSLVIPMDSLTRILPYLLFNQ